MLTVLRGIVSLARWLVILEIGIWRSLFFWVTRRVPGQRPGAESFSYAKEVTPLLGAFIFVSALEMPVVHLLLPWETVRLIALGIGIWGLLWMVGFLASMRVYRHLLDDSALRIRNGTSVDLCVPWTAIDTVAARRGRVPDNKAVHVEHGDDGAVVHVAVLKQTRVAVSLRRPTSIELPDGAHEISEVRLYVDNPRAFVAAARERLAARPAAERVTA